jgi:hypothetical protein
VGQLVGEHGIPDGDAVEVNGVFVGRVFDTYLGAAVIGCSLSGLLLGATPVTFGRPRPWRRRWVSG